uniref:F-box/kelch-repeat protein At1g74510-like n=1 Tax=Rhizophora mucronata TaxID=61149 RepID=A0A2P2N393_RHIMU
MIGKTCRPSIIPFFLWASSSLVAFLGAASSPPSDLRLFESSMSWKE